MVGVGLVEGQTVDTTRPVRGGVGCSDVWACRGASCFQGGR